MKKKCILSLLALIISMPMFATDYDAQGNLLINENNFPDPVFRDYLKTNTNDVEMGINGGLKGYGTDGKFSNTELNNICHIQISNLEITDLTGIEHFKQLRGLECSGCQLESLPINPTTHPYLKYLDITGCNLSTLDVTGFTKLEGLLCQGNLFTTIDVSHNENLTTLKVSNLESLDISHNKKLMVLFLDNVNQFDASQLESLDDIWTVYLSNLSITNLNFTQNTVLMHLFLSGNDKLTSLVLPDKNTEYNYYRLSVLSINDCPLLMSLDVSNYSNLKTLAYSGNGFKTVNINSNTNLTELICPDNQLISLDISHLNKLKVLECQDNQLTSLDLSNNTALEMLRCNDNKLTSLDLSNNTALKYLVCHNNQMVSLAIPSSTIQKGLKCDNNQLTELDLSHTDVRNMGGIVWGLHFLTYGYWCDLHRPTYQYNPQVYKSEFYFSSQLSPQTLSKDYVAIDGRGKLGVQCNTNDGVLTSYGDYTAMTSDGNNYIVVADEASGKTDVHAPNSTVAYNYNTGYTGTYDAAKTMEVNISTSAHGMYVHPETLRGSDNFYSGTLYLEFPARIPEGVQCYYAKGLDANEDLVGLTEVTGTIPANTAVIVKAPSEYKFFAFNESDETPDAPTDNIIEGTIEGLSVTPGTVLTLGHNVDRSTDEYDNFGFWNYRGNWINPFRAYIPKSSLAAGAKNGFSLLFPEDGTTGIARLTNSDAMTEDGTWYTLSGMRLTAKPTAKGIYVNGGKKVVIK